ncbi:uncharacterized protein PFL1_02334 [Pseudozyma flocculosa PF-1]|uniref:Related to Deoxyribodipyrimidine photo-lyase n=1 Tax=Pseudozyma flocculosa TaxID=84751 RepID=A0A5C3F646_9BASI|nr:uncharacterized protein PFL1_02334 [Pseudozyma flocculosa PF-1]EPQ30218.1 hypothetical protein PFL1_02334 [Pseudozyma flocculosa PF-1]SPO39852.1 related to Deoxyribodipyrimidine photo-lyase [Pseudozyma flocculosa]
MPDTLSGTGSSGVATSSAPTSASNSSSSRSRSPGSDTGRSILICLLRLDLRVHDNALFYYAHQQPKPILSSGGKTVDLSQLEDEALLGSTSDYLLPVFVFDEREMELSGLPGYKRKGPEARTRHYGFWKTGGFRTRFISESVYDLRSRLRDVGSDLMIRFGMPEDVVCNLVNALQANGDYVEGVWMQKEMTYPETEIESQIANKLHGTGVPVHFVNGKTLIHPADLPFPSSETPDVFTPFRKKVESLGTRMVRPAKESPSTFKPFPPDLPRTSDYALDVSYEVDVDGYMTRAPESKDKQEGQTSFHDILRYLLTPLNESQLPPTLEANALLQQRHPASAFPLRGGETSALDRLDWYFVRGKSADSTRWGKADPPPVARYKQTRNNLLGHAYSTKMSPFLAYGSISPRQIWEALDEHEQKFGEDQNTYWVRFELLWRDYFFFVAEKFGHLLYDIGGFEKATDPRQAAKKLEDGYWRWWDPLKDGPEHEITRLLEGRTGIPFIDANILELRESGFMSNRGRQNVASFLSKDLGYDWRIGAEFFQSHLIDYDPTSNYGNWQYVAGVGNDPRASRQFNTVKQAKDYDSHGDYVKMWIPALRNLHADFVHTPWLLDAEERRRYGLKTTRMDVTIDGYPERPLIEHEGWKRHYERRQGVGSKMYGNPQEKVKDGKAPPRRHKPAARYRPLTASLGGLSGSDRTMDLVSASAGTLHPNADGLHRNVIPPLRGSAGSIGPSYVQGPGPLGKMAGHGSERSSSPFTNDPIKQLAHTSGASMPSPIARAPGNAFDFGFARSSSANSNDNGRVRRSMANLDLSGGGASNAAAAAGANGDKPMPFGSSSLNHVSSMGSPAMTPNGASTPSHAPPPSKADTELSWRKRG